jgi:23S rRNA pseudouridine2605 synthase
MLDGKRTRPCDIERVSGTPRKSDVEGNTWLRVTLREGRTRQIRMMFAAIGNPVSKLKRVAIGPVRDPDLPPGAYRRLAPEEVEALRRLGKPR